MYIHCTFTLGIFIILIYDALTEQHYTALTHVHTYVPTHSTEYIHPSKACVCMPSHHFSLLLQVAECLSLPVVQLLLLLVTVVVMVAAAFFSFSSRAQQTLSEGTNTPSENLKNMYPVEPL